MDQFESILRSQLPITPCFGILAAHHIIYSMIAGLKVTYLYHDGDIIKVRIIAENHSFSRLRTSCHEPDGLLEAAAVLDEFPTGLQDTREVVFGAAGPKFAGGSTRLKFYCKDGAGHTAFLAEIEEDYPTQGQPQCASVIVDFEPASLDRFLIELRQVEIEHRGAAVWQLHRRLIFKKPAKMEFQLLHPQLTEKSPFRELQSIFVRRSAFMGFQRLMPQVVS